MYGDKTESMSALFYQLLIDQRVGGDDLYTKQPTELSLAKQLSQAGIQWLSLYDVYGAAGIIETVKGTCVNFTNELVNKVMNILSPVIEDYEKAGILDNMFVYGFDEVDSECEQSLRNVYGAIKKRWSQLRTMATLNWPLTYLLMLGSCNMRTTILPMLQSGLMLAKSSGGITV